MHFFLLDGKRQNFTLRALVLTALSGTCHQLLYGQNLEHTPVFSEAEFQEMMHIASSKFCDLPHTLLNQIKWKMKLSGGLAPKDHLHPSPFNMPMQGQSGVFAVDSHPLGLSKCAPWIGGK